MPPEPLRILIVEDNSGDALLEEIALKEQPFPTEIHWVSNGSDALAVLRQDASPLVDIVLLDGRLNGESSLSILVEIKAMPKHKDTPVVLLTGTTREQEADEYLAQGALAVLLKPTAFEDLVHELAGLRDLLPQHG